jgi:hypothetical protein
MGVSMYNRLAWQQNKLQGMVILLTQLADLVVFFNFKSINTNMNKLTWTTKDGRVMDVDSMSDEHVRNAFKMLLRTINKLKAEKQRSVRNITLSGDMAQQFNQTNFEDDNDERLDEVWEDVSFLNH